MLNDSDLNQLAKKFELHEFLSVSAPDIVNEKAFYHDIADNPVDCNIYHPKYGYPGFVQDNYSFVLTSYNPTIYKDPQTNQTVYCRDYLEVLCVHEDGTYSNKDGHQIVMVPFTLSGQTRPAGNEADLEEIYQRELSKKGLVNEGEEYSLLLKAELIEHTQELVRLYKEHFSYADRDLNLILLANKLIRYLGEESKQLLQGSMTPEKPTTSPTYDVKRLQTDYKYVYDKIDELTAYMATIEPYTERVLYFMRVSQDMGLGLSMFNMANRIIPERESQYNGKVHLNEAGNTVDAKSWGLSYSSETEHITLKKLWFLAVRHEQYSAFGRHKNIPLEQRKADYLASLPTIGIERYNRNQLKQIKTDIKELHEEYNKFQAKKTGDDKWEPESIERQRLNAPALVEHELMGIKAINWLAFHHSKYLQLFGILWDMVAFKLFLLNLSPCTDEPTDNVPDSVTTDNVPESVTTDNVPESVTTDNVPESVTTDNVPESVTTDNDEEDTESKQDTFRPFPDLLADSFTSKELDRLLIHVHMKDAAGKNIWPQKYKSAIWGVIKALDTKNHLIKTTGTEYSKSLSAYIDLGSTRVKHGHSTIEGDIKKKALSYLNQLVTSKK